MPLNNSPALTGKAATMGQLAALLEKYGTIDDELLLSFYVNCNREKATRKRG